MKSSTLRKLMAETGQLARKKVGAVYELPSGKRFYLAFKKTIGMHRSGNKSRSGAIRAHEAFWSIEDDTILQLRAKRVAFVGVRVKESEDVYLTSMTAFLRDAQYLPGAYTAGRPAKFLLVERFTLYLGAMKF